MLNLGLVSLYEGLIFHCQSNGKKVLLRLEIAKFNSMLTTRCNLF